MQQFTEILKTEYHLEVVRVTPQKGGWASLAYKAEASDGQTYFLKVYEKNRASTARLTALIDGYIPLVRWLNGHGLEGRIVRPLPTVSGANQCEDAEHIYLLFDFVEGDTIGEKGLDSAQVEQLAAFLSRLHAYDVKVAPLVAFQNAEDFSLPFIGCLQAFLREGLEHSEVDIRECLTPYLAVLSHLQNEAGKLASRLSDSPPDFVLCHTDLHPWNLMQSNGQLIVLDWEGLKLAPPEADLFMYAGEPYFTYFIEVYTAYIPSFSVRPDVLNFYIYRRKLEDMWEFIEQLIQDPVGTEDRKLVLNELRRIVSSV